MRNMVSLLSNEKFCYSINQLKEEKLTNSINNRLLAVIEKKDPYIRM